MTQKTWPQSKSHIFFFNDTATNEIYTLSLHDALPILDPRSRLRPQVAAPGDRIQRRQADPIPRSFARGPSPVHGRALGDELLRRQDRRALSVAPDKVRRSTLYGAFHKEAK